MTRTIAFAVAVFATAGCSVPLMRPAVGAEVYAGPPPGKALVNFHRPSKVGRRRVYSVFDGTTFLGNSVGVARFQVVADPGDHTFIGFLEDSRKGQISVVQATLAADKTYDCIVDTGFFKSSFLLNPIKLGDRRYPKLLDWSRDEEEYVIDTTQDVVGYEAARQVANERIIANFLRGASRDRLKFLDVLDCR